MITFDYTDPAQYVIQVPRTYMLDVTGGSPTEIRQLDINAFRLDLGDLQDDEENIWAPTTHFHTPPLTISGVTLARVLEILDPYAIEFEDGQYNVNITGGNSNISDVVIKNQVGVNTANSAGLQDPFALQAGAFFNEVAIDQGSSFSGTSFPLGTRGYPVNNLTDALQIAVDRGIHTFRVVTDMTLSATDFSDGYLFIGDGPVVVTTTINSDANVANCEFQNMTITGTLDNANTIRDCVVGTLNMFEGAIIASGLSGTVTIGAGTLAQFIDCYSAIAGGGPTQYAMIDMGGATGTDLIVRDYSGGIGFENCTASLDASIDMTSGRVIFENTITAGTFTVRGIADVTDNTGGTATVSNDTLQEVIPDLVWDEPIATHTDPTSAADALERLRKLMENRAVVSGDNQTITIYEDDNVTPAMTFSVSADRRERNSL